MSNTSGFHKYYTTTESVIVLTPTVDPEIRETIKDAFFLTTVVLLFICILKLIYISMVLFNVMTASDDTQIRQYPSACNLCCDIIHCIIMIVVVSVGIYSTIAPEKAFILGFVYLPAIIGSLISDFYSLISVCNSENHNEYTLSIGLIFMAVVITESLSLNLGSFYYYYAYLDWKDDNKDKDIRLLP